MTESNGAMIQARLEEIRSTVAQVSDMDPEDLERLVRELLAGISYERGVCATQAKVIKDLRAQLAGHD